MAATVQRTGQGPDRGTGQYSQDRERWWDDRQQRWFPTGPAADTLEIELEDYAGTSWLTSVLTTLGSQFGTGTYRFIGVAHTAATPAGPPTGSSGTPSWARARSWRISRRKSPGLPG